MERDHLIYPISMMIGMSFICIILFMEIFVPPSTFIFCQYLNYVLFILFIYLIAFVISYSKISTKRWSTFRDYAYVNLWINSSLCFLIGIAMKCLPSHWSIGNALH